MLYIAMRHVPGSDLREILRRPHAHPGAGGIAGRRPPGARSRAPLRPGPPRRQASEPAGPTRRRPDHVYLADFGITKHALSRSGLTPSGQFMGTIDYIAPEQVQSRESTAVPTRTRWAVCSTSHSPVRCHFGARTISRNCGRTSPIQPLWSRTWSRSFAGPGGSGAARDGEEPGDRFVATAGELGAAALEGKWLLATGRRSRGPGPRSRTPPCGRPTLQVARSPRRANWASPMATL